MKPVGNGNALAPGFKFTRRNRFAGDKEVVKPTEDAEPQLATEDGGSKSPDLTTKEVKPADPKDAGTPAVEGKVEVKEGEVKAKEPKKEEKAEIKEDKKEEPKKEK